MWGRFVKWTRRIGPDFVAGQDFSCSPVAAIRGRRPASRGQGWGRKAPPRRGLALTAARCDVIVLRLWGTGIGEDRGGIEVEVSVSFRDAWSRLKCAGWLPQDRVFGRERSAGLRTSVARAPPGGHRLLIASGRVAPRAVGLRRFDPSTVGLGPGVSVGQHRQRPAPAGKFAGDRDVGDHRCLPAQV